MSYPIELREDTRGRVISTGQIRVMFFTCDRESRSGILHEKRVPQGKNYVHSTLASLFMCDKSSHDVHGVDLLVGSPGCEYLQDFYKANTKVTIHPMPKGMLDDAADAHSKLMQNFKRALRYALSCPPEVKGFLICEDDVVFKDGFWGYAMDAINEMRCHKLKQDGNTLTFYSRYEYRGKKSYYRGRYFCSAGGDFTGLCGIYYDRECLQSLLDFLVKHEGENPADHLYWRWSNAQWTRYATPTGLIQHVGGISAGTSRGVYYWSDPRFEDEPACWDPVWVKKPYEPFEP